MTGGMVVVVFTVDFERMTDLYETALSVPAKRWNANWCEFELGAGSRFAIHRLRPESGHAPDEYHLNYLVDDVDAALERFRAAGAEVIRGVVDEAFGRVATVRDADGREFDLVEEGA